MKNRSRFLAWTALALGLGQIAIMLTAWLLTAAWPEDFTRSFLSAEGVRWFLGKFQSNLASPVLVWLLVCSIAYGAYQSSHICEYDKREYRQRFAMGVAVFELSVFVLAMFALTMLPHAILLNVMGTLIPSSFTQSIIPYTAFAITVVCCSFGVISGKVNGVEGVFRMLVSGIEWGAPYFVIYVFAAQLFYSILYVI